MGKLDSVACICIRQCKIPTVYGKGHLFVKDEKCKFLIHRGVFSCDVDNGKYCIYKHGKGESMIYCGVITKNVFLKHFEVVEDIITEVDMLFDKYFNCVI